MRHPHAWPAIEKRVEDVAAYARGRSTRRRAAGYELAPASVASWPRTARVAAQPKNRGSPTRWFVVIVGCATRGRSAVLLPTTPSIPKRRRAAACAFDLTPSRAAAHPAHGLEGQTSGHHNASPDLPTPPPVALLEPGSRSLAHWRTATPATSTSLLPAELVRKPRPNGPERAAHRPPGRRSLPRVLLHRDLSLPGHPRGVWTCTSRRRSDGVDVSCACAGPALHRWRSARTRPTASSLRAVCPLRSMRGDSGAQARSVPAEVRARRRRPRARAPVDSRQARAPAGSGCSDDRRVSDAYGAAAARARAPSSHRQAGGQRDVVAQLRSERRRAYLRLASRPPRPGRPPRWPATAGPALAGEARLKAAPRGRAAKRRAYRPGNSGRGSQVPPDLRRIALCDNRIWTESSSGAWSPRGRSRPTVRAGISRLALPATAGRSGPPARLATDARCGGGDGRALAPSRSF